MRLREHIGIIPGRIDILYCKPSEIAVEEGYNVRDLTTAEARAELDELKAQVKEHGVQTPLKIRFNGEQIILVEGHRRRTVALELIAEYEASGGTEGRNILSVPIFPEAPGTTVEERDAGLLVSNTGSRLKPLELANLIYRMNQQRGMPLEAVAKMLGISMPVLKNHLAMRAMPEPVKEQVRDGAISATEAARLVKQLPAGTDPIKAAEIIKANQEENKRLGVGKKTNHKVTGKTLQRDRPKAEAKPKPDAAPTHTTVLPPSQIVTDQTETGAPVSGAQSLDQLQDQIAGLTAGADGSSGSPVVVEDEAAATSHAKFEVTSLGVSINEIRRRAAELSDARPSNRIEALLLGFIATDLPSLASQYAKLCKEHDETKAESGDVMQGQQELCVAADVIGQLRFPDDWENAKATTELAQVA